MLEGNVLWRWVRSIVAAGLGALFCLASLTPLATAGAPAASCGSKTKCCCRRAHSTSGPTASSRACQSECGRILLSAGATAIYAAPAGRASSPVIVLGLGPRSAGVRAILSLSAGSHRQRPPPISPLA